VLAAKIIKVLTGHTGDAAINLGRAFLLAGGARPKRGHAKDR
jgi:hypothetical protein